MLTKHGARGGGKSVGMALLAASRATRWPGKTVYLYCGTEEGIRAAREAIEQHFDGFPSNLTLVAGRVKAEAEP